MNTTSSIIINDTIIEYQLSLTKISNCKNVPDTFPIDNQPSIPNLVSNVPVVTNSVNYSICPCPSKNCNTNFEKSCWIKIK